MKATLLLHHPTLVEYGRCPNLSLCTIVSEGMKSIDEEKQALVYLGVSTIRLYECIFDMLV